MRKLAICLILLAASALAQNYVLPDLKVNQEPGTCLNARDLLSAAQSDLIRLKGLIQNIQGSLSILDQVTGLVGQVCDRHQRLVDLAFLQAKTAKNKLNSASNARKIQSLFKTAAQDPIIQNMIGSKLDTILSQVNSLSSITGEEDIISTCNALQAAIQDLQNYLRWASSEISSKWINGYLPTRISDLTVKLSQPYKCTDDFIPRSKATITYSGAYAQGTIIDNLMSPGPLTVGWNSGGHAPQWITIKFPESIYVKSVQLVVDTYPNTNVNHILYVNPDTSNQQQLTTLSQYVVNDQVINVPVGQSITGLKIASTQSQSWIAWKRIIFYTGTQTCQCV